MPFLQLETRREADEVGAATADDERAAQTVRIDSYGLCLGFSSNDAAVLERMLALLAPGWRPSQAAAVARAYALFVRSRDDGPGRRLYADSQLLAADDDLEYLLDRLETDLQIFLGDFAPERVFVHAGVVGWQDQAIVIPGRTMSGKSTLVAAFLRAGASYFSDEFAVYDAQGRVHPYGRQLSLRQPAGRPRRTGPEGLGGLPAHEPLQRSAILLTRYRPGARWRPQTLSPGRAVLELMKHCLPARRRPAFVLAVLQQVLAAATVLRGCRGEADELVQELLAGL
jgi:hypothetical protein